MDPLLLAAGAARVAVWLAIAIIGTRQRRALPATFGTFAALTSVVFAITNAHGTVPGWALDIASFVALPVAVLILGHVITSRPTIPAPREGWRL